MRNVFFFHVHALVIEKMGGEMVDLHDGHPLIWWYENDLTLVHQICMSQGYQKY